MTNLGRALAAYEQKFDLTAKKLAAEIGLCESTITRVKQGKMLDAHGFVKVMEWLMSRP